jgi:UDP-glucuronate 4-epimerase
VSNKCWELYLKKILVTGAAGFIGHHLIKKLLIEGYCVVGIDNLNNYYSPQLKVDRLENIEQFIKAKNISDENYLFQKLDFANREALSKLFAEHSFSTVVHLGAQAGVRYSIEHPHADADSNLVGFLNILEECRQHKIDHFVYASSSSVYGMSDKYPLSTHDPVDQPISLYAATKRANELMAYSYSHLYQLPTTGLRFFTAYGPFGRPDMAYFKFTKSIIENSPIDVYNYGEMKRDFTYIDDIVDGIERVINRPSNEKIPYHLYNIGNGQSISLRRFISAIEKACGKKAIENHMPLQPGDVLVTQADIDNLTRDTGFKPTTHIEEGIEKFVSWYKDYYKV